MVHIRCLYSKKILCKQNDDSNGIKRATRERNAMGNSERGTREDESHRNNGLDQHRPSFFGRFFFLFAWWIENGLRIDYVNMIKKNKTFKMHFTYRFCVCMCVHWVNALVSPRSDYDRAYFLGHFYEKYSIYFVNILPWVFFSSFWNGNDDFVFFFL